MHLHRAAQPIRRPLIISNLEQALREIERLETAAEIRLSPDEWDLAHTLDHCARSIRFAMQGFPEAKNPLFQNTVGTLAFHVFDWRGKMSHNIQEEIPGCVWPGPPPPLEVPQALQALKATILEFQAFNGPLQPHFAYGSLNKKQSDKANAWHIADHLAALDY